MVLVLLLRADMTNKPSIACALQIIATISMGGCSRDRNSFDPEADRLLKGVSDYLASMDGFKFVAERTTEELLENDQKIHHTSLWDVQVQRPDRLRTQRLEDGVDLTMFYGDRTITIVRDKSNEFATITGPQTIDEAIDFAAEKLAMETPAGDLLRKDVYSALRKHAIGGTYVGRAQIDGIACEQIAYRGTRRDFELWVRAGATPIPMKYVVTSREAPGRPDSTAVIWLWKENPARSAYDLAFVPPPGAKQIELASLLKR